MHARQHAATAGPGPVRHRQQSFHNGMPTMSPPSAYRIVPDNGYQNGGSITGSHSSHTPSTHTATPHSPLVSEYAIKRESEPVADTPGNIAGIFEKDPQLGVEFILAYVRAQLRQHSANASADLKRLVEITESILYADPTAPQITRRMRSFRGML